MADPDPVEDAAAELYGLPLDGFIAARDSRAKSLRKDGDRDAAAQVAKLPKPSRVAAEVNRLAREGELDELLEAGKKLRKAKGGDAIRKATAAEREAVAEVVRGLDLSADQTERVRAILHALAGDDELRAQVEAGRLVKEPEAGGAWGFALEAPTEPAAPRRKAKGKRGGGAEARARERDEAAEHAPERKAAAKRRKAEADDEASAAERRKAEKDAAERREAEAREAEERKREEKERRKERERLERRLETVRARAAKAKERLDEARDAYEAAADEVARIEEQLG